jgi:hypothetical protein
MGQTRLDRYFALRETPRTPRRSYFLALPSNVRRKIYLRAGLVPSQYIDLNYWARSKCADEFNITVDPGGAEEVLQGEEEREFERLERHTSAALSLPLNLLLVCRTTYADVISLVYGSNSFTVSRHGPGGLGTLEKLSILALKTLQILTINLNDCSSQQCRVQPLGTVSRADKTVLKQWVRICRHLALYLTPSQLRLCIICDCEDWHTAREVTRTASVLPLLQHCAIRLSARRDEKLRQLAKHTALRLTGREEPFVGTFRFFDLPKEIQLRILEHTDLIANRTLEWRPHAAPEFHSSVCKSEVAVDFSTGGTGTELLRWRGFPGPYLCCRKVAAYSPHCFCRTFPASYFLVNHEVRNLATEVFYSRNHFVIFHKGRDFSSVLSQAEVDSIPLSTYLSGIPRDGIGNLTKLSLVFPPFEPTYLHPSQGGWKSWITGIEMLSQSASLNKLRLEIYFADTYWHEHEYARPHYTDQPHEHDIAVAYERILGPLAALRTLRCLGVYVSWPIGKSRAGERRKLESKLEISVMGEGYNGKAAGKSSTGRHWWENLNIGDAYI